MTGEIHTIKNDDFNSIYEVGEKIGDGHFAEVFVCTHRKTQIEFAAKFIKKKSTKPFNCEPENVGMSIIDIEKEAKILSQLNHDNIIKLYNVYNHGESVILVIELVTGGELFARVAECERLSEEEASGFLCQILSGVEHFHSKGIVHLDLKPENIMIEDLASRKIKIIDFGLARQLKENEPFQDMAGTPEFCAPEIVNFDPITFATDMWAVGVITYILLTGISPFAGDTQIETFQNILDCYVEYDRDEMDDVSQLAKDFIKRLLIRNPKKRATVQECLEHPWIKPKDTKQMISRRSSTIIRDKLNHLKNFVVSPNANYNQSSNNNSPSIDNNTNKDQFFASSSSSPAAKPKETFFPDINQSSNDTPTEPFQIEALTKSPSNCEDSSMNENTSKMDQIDSKTPACEDKIDLNKPSTEEPDKISVQVTDASITNKENTPTKVKKENSQPEVQSPSSWKTNFRSGVFDRIGAAFNAASNAISNGIHTINSSSNHSNSISPSSNSKTNHQVHQASPEKVKEPEIISLPFSAMQLTEPSGDNVSTFHRQSVCFGNNKNEKIERGRIFSLVNTNQADLIPSNINTYESDFKRNYQNIANVNKGITNSLRQKFEDKSNGEKVAVMSTSMIVGTNESQRRAQPVKVVSSSKNGEKNSGNSLASKFAWKS